MNTQADQTHKVKFYPSGQDGSAGSHSSIPEGPQLIPGEVVQDRYLVAYHCGQYVEQPGYLGEKCQQPYVNKCAA